jgi:hypothetical protein
VSACSEQSADLDTPSCRTSVTCWENERSDESKQFSLGLASEAVAALTLSSSPNARVPLFQLSIASSTIALMHDPDQPSATTFNWLSVTTSATSTCPHQA